MNTDQILAKKRAWKERKREADAIRGVRTVLRTSPPPTCTDLNGTEPLFATGKGFSAFIFGICFVAAALILLIGGCVAISKPAHAEEIITEDAVHAIIGEAENQGIEGMLAVACAIRNRGTLKGVYGRNAFRVVHHKYSNAIAFQASAAWVASSEPDNCTFVKGSTGWGNAKDGHEFAKTKWWKNCVVVYRHKDHFFYREVKS